MPARIGHRYQVLEQLGRGGMAVVYRVRDSSRGEELALKQLVLKASARDRELRAQFEQEFYVLAQLSHPSVIAVYDFGDDEQGPYYTMELLDGGDLSTRAPLDVQTACELMVQLCSSLSLLHSRKLVHRDISPRNVRCTPEGSAKLIDFGAMLPMGPCLQSVGTPSFVAPEVVHHLPIDARTDLFSLGATLYFALTGRKPFAARVLADLNEAWRKEPTPPSQLVAGIPPALDELVLSLLRIDPAGRPRNAFEVMQRLTAIVGARNTEPEQVAQAYLYTPALVGRDAERRRFRQRLRHALQGEGGVLVFEGEPGVGRSRLLDMCVIDAKLAGATVLRVDGRSALGAPLACAYTIAEQVLENVPDLAASCAKKLLAAEKSLVFANANAALDPAAPPCLRTLEELAADRYRAQSELSQWLRAVCEQQPLVLALDDIERFDDLSLAWIAGLAYGAGELRLLIVATVHGSTDTTARPALDALCNRGTKMVLAPLSARETETLLASMFSDAPRVALVSNRVHRLAQGNLRESMALARHMLEQGLIRYAEGNWILPTELAITDLPASAEEAVRARIALLPELPRRIAETQALAFEGPWTRTNYATLAGADADSRVDDAVAMLVRQGVLVGNAGTYTLSHLGVRACLIAGMPEAQRAQRHCELAEQCVRSGRPIIVEVHHWLLAGCGEQALDRLATLLEETPDVPTLFETTGIDRRTAAMILERAHVLAAAQRRPVREIHELARRLVEFSMTTDETLYDRHAATWLAQLERDSGLEDYRRTSQELTSAERMQQALQSTAARYAATAERDRAYRVDEAIKRLGHFVGMSMVMAVRKSDTRLHASLPGKLEPFAGLSPVLAALHELVVASHDLHCKARLLQAHERMLNVHASLERLADVDFPYLHAIRHSVAQALAAMAIMLGRRDAEHWLEIMTKDPLHVLGSLDLSRVLCVFDGDMVQAERYRKQVELLAIQTDGRGLFMARLSLELSAQLQVGDLMGVKQVADRIERLAAKSAGWLPLHHLAQASFQRLRGDLPCALEAIERCLSLADPTGIDPPPALNVWAMAAPAYVNILTDLGRADQARAFGMRALEQCASLAITDTVGLVRALALAEAKLGDHATAARRLDALIAERVHVRPAFLAADYEARARVAIAAKDAEVAERFLMLATNHHGPDANASLLARRGRLLDEAKRAGLELDMPVSGFESEVLGSVRPAAVVTPSHLLTSIDRLVDKDARAKRGLELLVQAAGARGGYLYYVEKETLLCKATFHTNPDTELDRFAKGYFQQQNEQVAMTTIFTEVTDAEHLGVATWTSRDGTVYRIALMPREGSESCVGLVALCGTEVTFTPEYRSLSASIGARLVALGDVAGAGAR
jgi:hypothetical protein